MPRRHARSGVLGAIFERRGTARALLLSTLMIAWPDERGIPEEGREGLRLFRESGAAAELAQARQRYHVVSWPWTRALPVRVVLADEHGDSLIFECEEAGRWRLENGNVEPHPRSAAAIAREAEAVPPPTS